MKKEEFWENAYRKNAPVLRGVLRRYISDTEVARDLLQDSFITAINKFDSYTGKGNFEGWLHRITVNTALMHLRKNKMIHLPVEMVVVADNIGAEAEYDDKDIRKVIEHADFSNDELLAAIDYLPEHHKVVFNMYVVDGFSHKDISEALNISVGTSKSHLARARKKIQQFLYEEALNKKKKKKSRRAFILFALPGRSYGVDKMFRKQFSDFTLPVNNDLSFISDAVESLTHAQDILPGLSGGGAAGFWGSKFSYVVLCGATALVTTSVCWFGFGDTVPDSGKKDSPSRGTEIVIPTIAEEQKDPDTTAGIPPEQIVIEEQKAPVVIHKEIIKRETIVVRDTVFIEE